MNAPEVECISKGKARKRYEFGCKVSVGISASRNYVLSVQALHGNPYDGHTLSSALSDIIENTGVSVKRAVVDKGYRGHDYRGDAEIHVVKKLGKKLRKKLRHLFRRRNAIEPVIGHMKSDNGMKRNYLKGLEGDGINAILCGRGYNLRKLLAAVGRIIFVFRYLGLFFRFLFFRNLISPANFLPVEAI